MTAPSAPSGDHGGLRGDDPTAPARAIHEASGRTLTPQRAARYAEAALAAAQPTMCPCTPIAPVAHQHFGGLEVSQTCPIHGDPARTLAAHPVPEPAQVGEVGAGDREQVARALLAMREHLRLTMLAQPTTGSRETYSDGYANGLATAIQALADLVDAGTGELLIAREVTR